jgi:hypothetical protein
VEGKLQFPQEPKPFVGLGFEEKKLTADTNIFWAGPKVKGATLMEAVSRKQNFGSNLNKS